MSVFRRGILPTLILALGIALLFWGATHHSQPVLGEQEIDVTIAVPPPMPPPGVGMGAGAGMPDPNGFQPPPGFGGPDGAPFAPPPSLKKVKQVVMVATEEPESQLVFEITFGGLTRRDTGELQRTYRGAPPSLCPT